jgi:hypothetical protein
MLIDMPLEQLRTYTGRNPRPADFDAFWDRALAEMRAVDPKVEMTRHGRRRGRGRRPTRDIPGMLRSDIPGMLRSDIRPS